MPETPQQAAKRQQLAALLQQQTMLPEQNMSMPSSGGSPQMPNFTGMAMNEYLKNSSNPYAFQGKPDMGSFPVSNNASNIG